MEGFYFCSLGVAFLLGRRETASRRRPEEPRRIGCGGWVQMAFLGVEVSVRVAA